MRSERLKTPPQKKLTKETNKQKKVDKSNFSLQALSTCCVTLLSAERSMNSLFILGQSCVTCGWDGSEFWEGDETEAL